MPTPRLTPLAPEQWTQEQRSLALPIAEATGSYNMIGTLLYHWDAFKSQRIWGAHVHGPGSTLDARLRELIILRVGFMLQCEYEWVSHKPQARRAGVTDDEIERVKVGGGAAGWSDVEAMLLDMTDDLINQHVISDVVWKRLAQRITVQQIFDAIFLVGHYLTTAMLAASARVEIDRGQGFTGFDPTKTF
jgi:AhpD family alkylhydroperoxidase